MLILILSLSCNDTPTTPDGDKTPPTVLTTSPTNSATNISAQTNIVITFSEPVDPADLNLTIFSIDPAITADISQLDSIVTIAPTSDLAYDSTYTLTITTALSDTASNNLAESFQSSFTIESDPNAEPPQITTFWPLDNMGNIAVAINPSVTFSKPMDPASLTNATFAMAGVSGSVTYDNAARVATFIPEAALAYNTTYNLAVSTAVVDTFGINLAERLDWSFSTRPDPAVPIVTIAIPADSSIIEDTITIFASVQSENGNDSVQFFVNGFLHTTTTLGGFFLYDATATALGSANEIYAQAFDTAGRVGVSDTLTIFYLWQPLITDLDPALPQDLQRIFYRTTDSILEFRCEFSTAWVDPINDTALDLAIFFDTDLSELTGRQDFGGHDLNDIGAEKRLIVGVHGDTALAEWNSFTSHWDIVYPPQGFATLNLLTDTTFFEVGLTWLDLDNSFFVDLVAVNAFFIDTESAIFDWAPNEGAGHLRIKRVNRFLGTPSSTSYGSKLRTDGFVEKPPNPFD